MLLVWKRDDVGLTHVVPPDSLLAAFCSEERDAGGSYFGLVACPSQPPWPASPCPTWWPALVVWDSAVPAAGAWLQGSRGLCRGDSCWRGLFVIQPVAAEREPQRPRARGLWAGPAERNPKDSVTLGRTHAFCSKYILFFHVCLNLSFVVTWCDKQLLKLICKLIVTSILLLSAEFQASAYELGVYW